jgi:hypothetical protein
MSVKNSVGDNEKATAVVADDWKESRASTTIAHSPTSQRTDGVSFERLQQFLDRG